MRTSGEAAAIDVRRRRSGLGIGIVREQRTVVASFYQREDFFLVLAGYSGVGPTCERESAAR